MRRIFPVEPVHRSGDRPVASPRRVCLLQPPSIPQKRGPTSHVFGFMPEPGAQSPLGGDAQAQGEALLEDPRTRTRGFSIVVCPGTASSARSSRTSSLPLLSTSPHCPTRFASRTSRSNGPPSPPLPTARSIPTSSRTKQWGSTPSPCLSGLVPSESKERTVPREKW